MSQFPPNSETEICDAGKTHREWTLLDGATGTELTRRGVNLSVPGWTARIIEEEPHLLWQIHRDYLEAGAQVLTANTFRTHARNLATLGQSHRAKTLTMQAVEIAQSAAHGQARVAGSVAPVGDCYSPDVITESEALIEAHEQMAVNLKLAGVDLILIETQVTIREAVIAASAARSVGVPFWVSFVTNRRGEVISGESLVDAYHALSRFAPEVFLVNCLPADEVLSTLRPLLNTVTGPALGAYANTGRLLNDRTWESTNSENPAVYAEFADTWIDNKLSVIGGCCGTTPLHISALQSRR